MPVCKKCNNYFSNRIKIDNKIRVLNSRKFCLDCSPRGLHNTRDITKSNIINNKRVYVEVAKKVCPKCNKEKDGSEYYRRRKDQHLSSYCKECSINQVVERTRAFKKACIEYKGGKCQRCGYNKYDGAMDFHHIEPTEKDFCISTNNKGLFNENIKRELDKCLLLCANCHREEHCRLEGYPANN